MLGLNAGLFRDYVQHIADRRLERIGLPRAVRLAESVPLDERDDRPAEGEELLRDARDRVPQWGDRLSSGLAIRTQPCPFADLRRYGRGSHSKPRVRKARLHKFEPHVTRCLSLCTLSIVPDVT